MSSSTRVRNLIHNRGIVLPGVLWITVLAIVITVNYSTDVQLNTKVVDNIKSAMVLKHDATSAMYIALDRMLSKPPAENTRYLLSLNDSQIDIDIKPENMKTDINTANADQLRRAFVNAGLLADNAEVLSDRVIDWRDKDHSRRLRGMEDADYVAEGSSYGSKDGRFDDLVELLLLADMDADTFRRLSDYFTTYGRSSGKLYTLTARAGTPATQQFYQISAVVQLTYRPDRPYRILKWQFNNS